MVVHCMMICCAAGKGVKPAAAEVPRHVGVQEALAFGGVQMRGENPPPPQPKQAAVPQPYPQPHPAVRPVAAPVTDPVNEVPCQTLRILALVPT